jgi:hypothetical protein
MHVSAHHIDVLPEACVESICCETLMEEKWNGSHPAHFAE